MSRSRFAISGKTYAIAQKTTTPAGGRIITIETRAWQQGDPAQQAIATWRPDGPNLYSQEDVTAAAPEGLLAVDYLDSCDSRWANRLTLGPALTAITLTTQDTTFPETLLDMSALLDQNTGLDASPGAFSQGGFPASTVSDIDWIQSSVSGTYYAYFLRDGYVTKINLSTLAVVETHAFSDLATDLIGTQTPAGTREISVALNASPYQVANPIAAADTWAANGTSTIRRVFGLDPLRVVGGYLNTGGQTTYAGNVLTSTVTMLAPAWFDVASITGKQSLLPSGFTVDGARWVMLTTGGPYFMDPSLGIPFALIPDMDVNTENGRQGGYWPFLGVIIPGRYGARFQHGLDGASFGVEIFDGNRSPVQGYPTGEDGNLRWYYQVVYNVTTTTSWLVAFRHDARETRVTGNGPVPVSPFVIGKIGTSTAAVSRALKWVGTANQSRSTAILLGGNGTNGFSMIMGETPQEVDDSAYRYALSGTAYMTELRRYPHLLKDLEGIEFETTGATASRTVTVTAVCSGDVSSTTVTLNGTTAGVNDAVSTNGYQRRLFVSNAGVPNANASGRRIKLQFAFATDSSAAAPSIIGNILLHYQLRPQQINEVTIQLQIEDDDRNTAYDKILELQALENAGPVLVNDDYWGNSYFARVAKVDVPPEFKQGGGSPDRPKEGSAYVIPMTYHIWINAGNGIQPS